MTLFLRTFILFPMLALFAASCNSKRGESRDEQLEQTAESLEAKAENVRLEAEKSAEMKITEAKAIREIQGDEKTAEILEKDASVTRKAGETRAEQLEKRADKVREQKIEKNTVTEPESPE